MDLSQSLQTRGSDWGVIGKQGVIERARKRERTGWDGESVKERCKMRVGEVRGISERESSRPGIGLD